MAEYLKTDYVDDELDIAQNITRKHNIKSENGALLYEKVEIEDVTKYSKEGTPFGAVDINKTNNVVNEHTDQLKSSIVTKYDEETGQPMWKEQGADTWNFFKSGKNVIFKDGIINASMVTGGIIGRYAEGRIELTEESLGIYGDSNTWARCILHNIDMTNYSKLILDCRGYSTDGTGMIICQVGAYDTTTKGFTNKKDVSLPSTRQTIEIDISDINGSSNAILFYCNHENSQINTCLILLYSAIMQ